MLDQTTAEEKELLLDDRKRLIVRILVKRRYHQDSSVLRQVNEVNAKLPLDGILPDDLQDHKVNISPFGRFDCQRPANPAEH